MPTAVVSTGDAALVQHGSAQQCDSATAGTADLEQVAVGSGGQACAVATHAAVEFVEDAVVLVQVAQLRSKMFVYRNRLDRLLVHVDIPYFQCEVVTRQNITTISTELDIGDTRNDLREEGLVRRILFLFGHGAGRKGTSEGTGEGRVAR